MSSGVPTSDCAHVEHACRTDVLTFFLERALRETPFTLEDFAARLATTYHARVPLHARTLEIVPPDTSGDYAAYAREVGRLRKRVQRYIEHEVHLPVELEEPWVYSLPEPYGERCRHELAWRYGLLGAPVPGAEPCSDAEMTGALMSASGRAATALARALTNGGIEPDDLTDGLLERELRELEAAVSSIRARVQWVRDRVSAPWLVDEVTDRRQRMRAAHSGADK